MKVVGIAGGVSAAMGYPAVLVRFDDLGIPFRHINYEMGLRAGAAPGVVALLQFVYFAAIMRRKRSRGESEIAHLSVLVARPLSIPSYCMGVVFSLPLLWLLAWLFTRPIGWLGLTLPSNAALAWFALTMMILGYTTFILRNRLASSIVGRIPGFAAAVSWIDSDDIDGDDDRAECQPGRSATHLEGARAGHLAGSASYEQAEVDSAWELLQAFAVFWIGMPVAIAFNLWLAHSITVFAFPALGREVSAATLVWVGVSFAFLLALPHALVYGEIVRSSGQSDDHRARGLVFTLASLFIVSAWCIAVHALKVYPHVPQAGGGGKLEPLTAWIDHEALPPPETLERIVPGLRARLDGEEVVRVDSQFSFRGGDSLFLLGSGRRTVDGVVVKTDDVKAIAWGISAESSRNASTASRQE